MSMNELIAFLFYISWIILICVLGCHVYYARKRDLLLNDSYNEGYFDGYNVYKLIAGEESVSEKKS